MKIFSLAIILLVTQSVTCGFVEPEGGFFQNPAGIISTITNGIINMFPSTDRPAKKYNDERRVSITKEKFNDELENIGLKLAEGVYKDCKSNVAFSPIGAALLLSAMAVASSGNTKWEIKKFLNIPSAQDYDIYPYADDLIQAIQSLEKKTLFFDHSITAGSLEPTGRYTDKIINSFNLHYIKNNRLSAEEENFLGDDANAFAKYSPITLDSRVYFRSNWLKPFNNYKVDRFITADNEGKIVDMIGGRDWFYHGGIPEWKADFVEVPCQDDTKMIFVFPASDMDPIKGMKVIESNIHELQKMIDRPKEQKQFQLWIPKFMIKSRINLRSQLEKFKVKKMFTAQANFTAFWMNEHHQIDDFHQTVIIRVDNDIPRDWRHSTGNSFFNSRYGTDELIINQPFVTVVVHKGMTLITAKIVDPTNLFHVIHN